MVRYPGIRQSPAFSNLEFTDDILLLGESPNWRSLENMDQYRREGSGISRYENDLRPNLPEAKHGDNIHRLGFRLGWQ